MSSVRYALARALAGRELDARLRGALERDVQRGILPGISIGATGYFQVRADAAELAEKGRISGLRILRDLPGQIVGARDVDHWCVPHLFSRSDAREALRQAEIVGARDNAFVNLGLHFLLDRLFNLNTPNTAITHMGVSADVTTVIAGTLAIDPAPTTTTTISTLGTGTGATATSRTAETVTCSCGWNKSGGTNNHNGVFAKAGLFNTSTDAADDTVPTVQGVMNIIGGAGGSSPYNEPFTIDLTALSAYAVTLAMDITPTAT